MGIYIGTLIWDPFGLEFKVQGTLNPIYTPQTLGFRTLQFVPQAAWCYSARVSFLRLSSSPQPQAKATACV